jgi:hypothetical protein
LPPDIKKNVFFMKILASKIKFAPPESPPPMTKKNLHPCLPIQRHVSYVRMLPIFR